MFRVMKAPKDDKFAGKCLTLGWGGVFLQLNGGVCTVAQALPATDEALMLLESQWPNEVDELLSVSVS